MKYEPLYIVGLAYLTGLGAGFGIAHGWFPWSTLIAFVLCGVCGWRAAHWRRV